LSPLVSCGLCMSRLLRLWPRHVTGVPPLAKACLPWPGSSLGVASTCPPLALGGPPCPGCVRGKSPESRVWRGACPLWSGSDKPVAAAVPALRGKALRHLGSGRAVAPLVAVCPRRVSYASALAKAYPRVPCPMHVSGVSALPGLFFHVCLALPGAGSPVARREAGQAGGVRGPAQAGCPWPGSVQTVSPLVRLWPRPVSSGLAQAGFGFRCPDSGQARAPASRLMSGHVSSGLALAGACVSRFGSGLGRYPGSGLWPGHVSSAPAMYKARVLWPGSGQGAVPMARLWPWHVAYVRALARVCFHWPALRARRVPGVPPPGQPKSSLPRFWPKRVPGVPALRGTGLFRPGMGQGMTPVDPSLATTCLPR
jgi:hypothetical protein